MITCILSPIAQHEHPLTREDLGDVLMDTLAKAEALVRILQGHMMLTVQLQVLRSYLTGIIDCLQKAREISATLITR